MSRHRSRQARAAKTDPRGRNNATLEDVVKLPAYAGKPGTYGSGNTPNQKLDCIFLSPALHGAVQAVGVERGGVYAPLAGNPFPEVTSKKNQASDYGAVWVDLDIPS